jgi:hypothetical protein
VWPVVRDLRALPKWWPEVQQSTRLEDGGGRERWQQLIAGVELTMEVVADEPPHRLGTRIIAPDDGAFGGAWQYDLQSEGNGTRVRVTEQGWIGPWPFRTITWMSGYHTSIDSYLASLGRHFDQQVTPIHVEPAPDEDVPTPPAAGPSK